MRGSSGRTVFENKVHACTVILHFPLTITLCIVHGFGLIVDTVLQSALHIMLIIIQFSRTRCQGVKGLNVLHNCAEAKSQEAPRLLVLGHPVDRKRRQ